MGGGIGDGIFRFPAMIMYSKINDVLNGKVENSFYPFFWQHGETEAVLRQYMEKIRFDAPGSVKGARINISYLAGRPWDGVGEDISHVIGVYMANV